MNDDATPLLILGLGNLICGDDGLGVVAVERLRAEYHLPEGVVALDGGTLGLSLLPHLQAAERAILIDAIEGDLPPGGLVRLEGEEVAPAAAQRLSVHQIGVLDLLQGAHLLGDTPQELVLLGLVPKDMPLAVECSAEVQVQIPALVDAVVREAMRMGFELEPRGGDESSVAGDHGQRHHHEL